MRRYLGLIFIVMFVFAIVGCGDEEKAASVVEKKEPMGVSAEELNGNKLLVFSEKEIAQGTSFTKEYSNSKVNFKYPSDWLVSEDGTDGEADIVFEIAKDNSSANMNLIVSKSDKYFKNVTVKEFEKEYPKVLKTEGFKSIKMLNTAKGEWQSSNGLVTEFTGTMDGYAIHLIQYIYDNGDDLLIFTFAAGESEWKENIETIRSLMSSVKINK